MLSKILRFFLLLFFGAAMGIWGTAYVLDHYCSQDILPVTPHSLEAVEFNREMWMKGDSVAEIYGIPGDEKIRVVLPDESKLIHPKEDPNLALLLIDKQHGENPLQVKTVWFIANRAAAAALILGHIFLFLSIGLRIKKRRKKK